MRSGVFVLGLVFGSSGCGFNSHAADDAGPIGTPGGGPDASPGQGNGGGDAPGPTIDARMPVPPDACVSFSQQFDTCELLASFAMDVRIGVPGVAGAEYDTDTHVLTVDGMATDVPHMTIMTKGQMVDAILGRDVFVAQGVVLHVSGKSPFAIVASGSIQLEHAAMINVAAGGAGALDSCSSPAVPGTNDNGGAGGGGGGGYGAAGGAGGPGNKDSGGGKTVGGAGSNSIAAPPGPQGGCAGAKGGDGDTSGRIGGAGGLGGGAIYLLAADTIQVGEGAVLNASGGGGKGGAAGDAGGGGGGSGGMIWLEAPHVLGMQSQIAANGGGGGEGANGISAGANGQDGGSSVARARGGSGSVNDGGDGGDGGSDATKAGGSSIDFLNGAGGGGGGGVGYIHVVSPDFQPGEVSPAAN